MEQDCLIFHCFVASCSYLKEIPNGVMNGKTQTHGSIIQFNCKDGYRLIGPSNATCEDGKWSETLPRCVGWCFVTYFYLKNFIQ